MRPFVPCSLKDRLRSGSLKQNNVKQLSMATLPTLPHSRSNSKSNPAPEGIVSTTKSGIESLPPELLLQVIGEIDHEDIQNFACCCRYVWMIAEKAFEEHKRRRKYFTVRIGIHGFPEISSTDNARHPVEALQDLLTDDELVIYPKRMIIGSFRNLGSRGLPFLTEQQKKIHKMLKECRYLRTSREKPVFYNAIVKYREPYYTTNLLLNLLPNLRAIELRFHGQNFNPLGIVRSIACATRLNRLTINPSPEELGKREEDSWDSDKPHALSRLTELRICTNNGGWQDFAELTWWAWLPSLRSIRGEGLHSFKDREPTRPPKVPDQKSGVVSLELEECMVCERDFQILLKSIKGLRNFEYHYGVPETTEGRKRAAPLGEQQWNPRGLVELLSTYASHSLVSLDLTKTGTKQIVHGKSLAGRIFIGSLRRFHLLQKLRVDIMVFVESPLENLITKYSQIYRADSHEKLVKRIGMTERPSPDQAHRLVDLLPASLEELGLCSTHYDYRRVIDRILHLAPPLKAERLPHLSKIVFESISLTLLNEITRKAWTDAGVQMCLQIPIP